MTLYEVAGIWGVLVYLATAQSAPQPRYLLKYSLLALSLLALSMKW